MNPPANAPDELVIQLRAEMARQGLTIADVARRLGVKPRTEQGRFANPHRMPIVHAIEVADALGVPFSTITERAEHAGRAVAA